MGFTKLDEGILQSSVMAADPVTFKVWIALLAACKADGVAAVAPTFLASVCRLTDEQVRTALVELAAPDKNSRGTEADGRRVERVDGGWRVINYARYRREGLRAAATEVKREYRAGERADARSGMVYFARSGNRIKIGFSKNPWARVAELRTAAPDIVLLGSVSGTEDDESAFHVRFKSYCVGGEWFRADDTLVSQIAVVLTTGVRSPDCSASASPSVVVVVEGGVGGDPRPEHERIRGSNFREASDLDVKILQAVRRISERTGTPAWEACRKVTSYKRPDGSMTKGVEDPARLGSILARQKALEDAEWWLAELDKEAAGGKVD